MTVNARFRRNVRIFYGWLGSMVLMGVAPIAARWCIRHETTPWRAAGVFVGVAGMVPWIWLVSHLIRHGDEFERRMHLVAIAVAAAAGLIFLVTLAWLVDAHFIEPPDLALVWVAMLVLWLIAMLGTKRYYERER
jgi:hypothetical protein